MDHMVYYSNLVQCGEKKSTFFLFTKQPGGYTNIFSVNRACSIPLRYCGLLCVPNGMNLWGTPSSKPPEITTGQTIDFSKADIYSMGHMLLSLMSTNEIPVPFDFSTKPAQDQAQIIKEHLEPQECNISVHDRYPHDLFQLNSLVFAMVRNDFDERISVQDAIHSVQYLLWGKDAHQDDLKQWKENIIRETATQDIPRRPMTMNDILKLEYVSSLTLDELEQGKQQYDLVMRQFEQPEQPHRLNMKADLKTKHKEKTTCEDCNYPPADATKYCHNEGVYLCEECCTSLHQRPRFRNHDITSL